MVDKKNLVLDYYKRTLWSSRYKTVYLIYARLLVHVILSLAYFKKLCVLLKVNICKICYTILSCSRIFYNVLCDCVTVTYSVMLTLILDPKIENQTKRNKIKIRRKIK